MQVLTQMAMLLLYCTLLGSTIYKYVNNVPSPDVKSVREKKKQNSNPTKKC